MGFYRKMTEIYQEKKKNLKNQCINRKKGVEVDKPKIKRYLNIRLPFSVRNK